MQGDTAPNTYVDPVSGTGRPVVNAGEIFKPYATRQGEIGAKYDAGRFGTTFSMFYTAKPIASVNLATSRYEITDYQRNRGAEVSFFGEATPAVRILGGASYLQAEVTGRRAIGAPRFQSNLGLEWDIPRLHGLTLDGRMVQTSTQFADATNAQELPSWWRLDLGARYAFDLGPSKITLRGRLDNVTNRNEWVSAGGYPGAGYLVLGAPRTFVVSGTVAF